jgi:DNA-directed RNA polymerase subunit RPC12/RpoP
VVRKDIGHYAALAGCVLRLHEHFLRAAILAAPRGSLRYDWRMQLSFSCPRCEQPVTVNASEGDASVECPHCQLEIKRPADAWQEGTPTRCLVCPSTDLFVRKNFPQRLGLTIVVLGFALSCVTWFFYWTTLTFAVLFVTALADFVLYLVVGDSLKCYRCGAEYRQLSSPPQQGAFDLETHERYRQQTARLAQTGFDQQQDGPTARTDPGRSARAR